MTFLQVSTFELVHRTRPALQQPGGALSLPLCVPSQHNQHPKLNNGRVLLVLELYVNGLCVLFCVWLHSIKVLLWDLFSLLEV